MKKTHFIIASVCLPALLLLAACTQRFPGYQKTETGLYYKFYSHDLSAQQPNQTDILKVAMTCYLGDSVYYDFQQTNNQVYAQLKESVFPADLNEAYAMMHLGDSASFYIKADSVAYRYYGKQPEAVGLKADDYFRYEIKLLEIKTPEEFKAEIEQMSLAVRNAVQEEQSPEEVKDLQTLKAESEKAFADYLKANGIVDYTSSGLYYKRQVTTDGAVPQKGQKVVIKYVATFIDGTPLGNSDELGGSFDLVYGNGAVIKGLEEGIGMMHLGEKTRFVLPYPLAYGVNSYQNIPACSNLVFDVELVEIQ